MLKNLKMIPCCVTPSQHAALKALSKRTHISIQDYLREAVADMLAKHPPPSDSGYITTSPAVADIDSNGSGRDSSYITEQLKGKSQGKRKGKAPLTAEQIAAFDAVWYEPADLLRFAERCATVDAMRAAGWRPPKERLAAERRAAAAGGTSQKNIEREAQRRRRLKELHPDKLGRDHTPAERAEYTKITKRKRHKSKS